MTRSPLWEEVLSGDEVEHLPTPDPLIEGILYQQSSALIYGAPGVGKSIVSLDWAMHLALGLEWYGHPVIQSDVLYVVGEGLGGIGPRYAAWKQYHEVGKVSGIHFAPRAVDLQTHAGKEELYRTAEKFAVQVVVLDTLARHIPGGDENSFQTVSHLVEAMDEVRRITGGCTLGVHHPGKDQAAGARGHSSLKGALDTEILAVTGPTLRITKQKDHSDGISLGSFQLTPVGKSVVLTPREGRAPGVNEALALACLNGAAVSHGEWKSAAVEYGVPEGSFARVRKALVTAGEVILVTDTDTGDTRYRLK